MHKKLLLVVGIVIIGVAFYWFELKPRNDKQECFVKATEAKEQALNADNNVVMFGLNITRANYEKIFNDEYDKCLKAKGY